MRVAEEEEDGLQRDLDILKQKRAVSEYSYRTRLKAHIFQVRILGKKKGNLRGTGGGQTWNYVSQREMDDMLNQLWLKKPVRSSAIRDDLEAILSGRPGLFSCRTRRVLATRRAEIENLGLLSRVSNALHSDLPQRLAQVHIAGGHVHPPRRRHGGSDRHFQEVAVQAGTFANNGGGGGGGGGEELRDIRRLLQISLGIQAEVQRSLRQELAALYQAIADSTSSSSLAEWAHITMKNNQHKSESSPEMNSEEERGCRMGLCVVCSHRHVDALMYRCGHCCTCFECAKRLEVENRTCPICRAPILEVVQVYTSAPSPSSPSPSPAAP